MHKLMNIKISVPRLIRWAQISLFCNSLNFLDRFSKKSQISNFTKFRPVGAKLFHADRRTDGHDKANSAFRNFANTPKKQSVNAVQ